LEFNDSLLDKGMVVAVSKNEVWRVKYEVVGNQKKDED
jgi:hypothetical protein